MKKRPPVRKAATQEARGSKENRGSKEGITTTTTKKQSTIRRPSKVSANEDDGTQIEQTQPKKGSRTHRKRREAEKTQGGEAQGMQQSLRQFTLATIATGVPALVDEFLKLKFATQACSQPKTAFDSNPDKNRYRVSIFARIM